MALQVEWDQNALNALLNGPTGPVARDLERRAINVETTAKRITGGPGGGRTYQHRGISHTASAPGQPFASDTGRLRASITHELTVDSRGLVARIGSDVEYAAFVELGTSRAAARPYLRPSLSAAR